MMNGIEKTETLATEVKKFADELPYWMKYLAAKILSGNVILDADIDASYLYLLEDLNLREKTKKLEIIIGYNTENTGNYKSDLLLSELENVEGVNALMENQIIKFASKLTIIYGVNGSGKSSYVRLLKKVFYSKSPEVILQNVHIESGHKQINAKFTFSANSMDIPLDYSNKDNPEFQQFAVFDGKSELSQLEEKNEFAFRPAGLSFFANFTVEVQRVEKKLNAEIQKKESNNEFADLFEGDSEIKTLVENLSATTKFKDLNKYIPFSDEDKSEKSKVQKRHEELLLASKNKEKQINNLNDIKKLLSENKTAIENINQHFTSNCLVKIKDAITGCIGKESIAKLEEKERFKTDKIKGIGTAEWKNFIVAATAFAQNQKPKNTSYPEKGDNCLLCHQPLSDDAGKLISCYGEFIKSVAEADARQAQETLGKAKQDFEKLNFSLFPENDILTIWFAENYPEVLEILKQKLSEQETLSKNIISDIQNKTANNRAEININFEKYADIMEYINTTLEMVEKDEQSKGLEKSRKEKIFLEHKEKFNIHFEKFKTYVNNQVWIKRANQADYAKHKVTLKEKALSDKYFTQKYIDAFNRECQKLKGNFGIEISHTARTGRSYKKFILKGEAPNAVLSEGEQKVIAIADFIAEVKLSEINRGIIFDDPVNSLDEWRKNNIAKRLVDEANVKQVIIFTHDLAFVYSLIGFARDMEISHCCHWIESANEEKGKIHLNNAPSYEKEYRTSNKAQKIHDAAKKAQPEERERQIGSGFAALRTSYEALVVFDLFGGVVQRFSERVSVDSLSKVVFNENIRDRIMNGFHLCCRYMEGHLHSEKSAHKNSTIENLMTEISKFDAIKKEIKELKK